jgi:hypothetical protein
MHLTREKITSLCNADTNEKESSGVQERAMVLVAEILEATARESLRQQEVATVKATADNHPSLVDDDMKIKDRMLDRKSRGTVIFAA